MGLLRRSPPPLTPARCAVERQWECQNPTSRSARSLLTSIRCRSERPNGRAASDQGVARAQLPQQKVELRSLVAVAADVIGEHASTLGAGQRVTLEVGVLLKCRDSGTAEELTHAGSGSEIWVT